MSGMKKMKPKWKRKWLRALRGKKYVQGQERLRTDDDHFCCLGVLCDVMAKEKWRHSKVDGWFHTRNSDTLVPPSLRRLAGLHPTEQEELWNMNDRGDSFGLIADWIEQNL